MHISEYKIKNVTSYYDETIFKLKPDLNIFIGPNGGGKTNAVKALWIPLQRDIFAQYKINLEEKNITNIHPDNQMIERHKGELGRYTDEEIQEIEVTIETDSTDAENIRMIKKYKNEIENRIKKGIADRICRIDERNIRKIEEGVKICYKFVNNDFKHPSNSGSLEDDFYAYCCNVNLVTQAKDSEIANKISNPILFIGSTRDSNVGYIVPAEGVTNKDLNDSLIRFYSNAGGNISELSTKYFGYLMRRAVNISSTCEDRVLTAKEVFYEDEEVKIFKKYLDILGYDWTLQEVEGQFLQYESIFKRDGKKIDPDKFSSGEKEIISFLSVVISTRIKNGIILIDEPELHLHPRWQKILLSIIKELSKTRNIQFIFNTHSPVFVMYDNIESVTRIYQIDNKSRISALGKTENLLKRKHLARIVNSHNNERLFFCDKVILVEGISDRIVFESIVSRISDKYRRKTTFEVVEVHGTPNFEQYIEIARAVDLPFSIVADNDYLERIGNKTIKELFVTDRKSIDEKVLKEKKSKDANTLIWAIENALKTGDMNGVKDIVEYIKSRKIRKIDNLTEEQEKTLDKYIEEKKREGIYILRKGEIEDYLPNRESNLDSIIKLIKDENWMKVLEREKAEELVDIIINVMVVEHVEKEEIYSLFWI